MPLLEFPHAVGHLLKGICQPGNFTADFGEISAQSITSLVFGKVGKLFDRQKYLAVKQGTDRADRQDQDHATEHDHAVLQLPQSLLEGRLRNTDIEGSQQALPGFMKVTGRVGTFRFIVDRRSNGEHIVAVWGSELAGLGHGAKAAFRLRR